MVGDVLRSNVQSGVGLSFLCQTSACAPKIGEMNQMGKRFASILPTETCLADEQFHLRVSSRCGAHTGRVRE